MDYAVCLRKKKVFLQQCQRYFSNLKQTAVSQAERDVQSAASVFFSTTLEKQPQVVGFQLAARATESFRMH